MQEIEIPRRHFELPAIEDSQFGPSVSTFFALFNSALLKSLKDYNFFHIFEILSSRKYKNTPHQVSLKLFWYPLTTART